MAIFFNVGYVLEDRPKRAVICAKAVHVAEVQVTAIWPRDAGPC